MLRIFTIKQGDQFSFTVSFKNLQEDLTDTLNQIISSPLPTGTNTMSITNTDVIPDLTISYYDYEENNQYRKYVYIIDSSNFEEI